ncbi:MAG TPA: PLP-dependent aminotransferase family protein [bacterium]|nr:PLP-dependent aminotransferase family protein [bacterium]
MMAHESLALNRESETPLYRQLHAGIASMIRSGQIGTGERLPSVRQLARRLDVSLITVVQAYQVLAADGLVQATVGRGTYAGGPQTAAQTSAVSRETAHTLDGTEWQSSVPIHMRSPRVTAMEALLRPVVRSSVIALAGGIPDPTLFPVRALGRMWHRALAVEDPKFLQYGSPQGDLSLRGWIAEYCGATGITARPDDVLITSGSQQAIDLVARTLLAPGDHVLVESPTFPTALDVFEGRGVNLVGVPVDSDGMRVEMAAALVERYRPRLIYTIPTAQNPTGAVMSDDRRRRLAALARQHNLIVLEDDICSEFSYDGDAPSAVKAYDSGGHVMFVRSFSKTVIPGLRVGCVVAHGPLMARLIEAKLVMDRFTSPLIQRTLWRYLSSKQYARDLRIARETYRRRRDTVLRMLEASMPAGVTWSRPAAGFNLWVTLPPEIPAREAFNESLKEGVACGLGDLFLPHTPPPSGLRLSFADKPEELLAEGVRRLSAAMRRLLATRARQATEQPEYVTSV